jgi:hypothetical protein
MGQSNEPASSADFTDLMPSLARLVRGLSALFWGLPAALVICVQTAKTNFFGLFGIVPPLLATGLLWYAVRQLGHFRSQERVWRSALDRAQVTALINIGLAPFLHWGNMMPDVLHYQSATLLMALSGLLFLFLINRALQRLAAMLPDEALRLEAALFTTLNLYLLLGELLLAALWTVLLHRQPLPPPLQPLLGLFSRVGLLVLLLLLLLPLALTMTLVWKIKETILTSVFAPKEPARW